MRSDHRAVATRAFVLFVLPLLLWAVVAAPPVAAWVVTRSVAATALMALLLPGAGCALALVPARRAAR